MHYIKRNVLLPIQSRLEQDRVIVVTGARQTGKTTLCTELIPDLLQQPYTYISFDDPDERIRFQNAAVRTLDSITTPIIVLDEVQKFPALFDPLKYVIDKEKRKGKQLKRLFLLTGSSQLMLMKSVKESLAGRIALFNLSPFSYNEVLECNSLPLLDRIWQKNKIAKDDVNLFLSLGPDDIRYALQKIELHKSWGGYPPIWQRKKTTHKINWLKDYRTTYVEKDITDVGQISNVETFVLIQKLLCVRTAQLFSISAVARDAGVAVNTVKRYINLLTFTFQCHILQPYFENIGKRFIKSAKIFFPDAGLNSVLLGEMSIDTGAAYETWVFSELDKWRQLQEIKPDLFFYRTAAGMEIDFLLVGNGSILPIEVKSAKRIDSADVRNLKLFLEDHKTTTKIGIVIYPGNELQEITKGIWSVPDWYLFGGFQSLF